MTRVAIACGIAQETSALIVVGAGAADALPAAHPTSVVVAASHSNSSPAPTAKAKSGAHKSKTKTAARKKSRSKRSKHHRAKQPVVTTSTVTERSAIPFQSTTVSTNTLAKGVTRVTTAGVNGVMTTTYEVTTTDGVQTAKTQVSQAVTTPPVTQVTSVGTYVAPAAPAPAPAPARAQPAPAPASGGTVDPGGYCDKSEVGVVGVAANGHSYKCGGHGPDARGEDHWNTIP